MKAKKFVDYYAVLNIWPTASEDIIKKAYFTMAKLHHPDVAGRGGEESESDVDFKLINEAYSVLSDAAKRREYDEILKMHRLMDENRFTIVVAARRSGKTVAAINHLLAKALSATDGRSRFAYIAPQLKMSKSIAWDYLKEFSRVVPMVKYHEGELRCDLPNGSRIRLYGVDNPDAIRGQYFDGCVLDEYGMFPHGAFDKVIRPALADRRGFCEAGCDCILYLE